MTLYWAAGAAVGALAASVWALTLYFQYPVALWDLRSADLLAALLRIVMIAGPVGLLMVPAAILVSAAQNRDSKDWRRRLHAADVPQNWRPASGEEAGLKRVFD